MGSGKEPACKMRGNVRGFTAELTGTGDRSEYDIEG